MHMKMSLFLFTTLALAALCPARSQAQTSSIAEDLIGRWRVETPEGYSGRSSRIFEFFPDGRVVETSSYSTSSGESTNAYKKTWKVVGSQVVITRLGDTGGNGQSIAIDIPFDLARVQIVETWETPTSTRTTKMFALRDSPTAPSDAHDAAQPAASGASPQVKVEGAVVPSVKSDRDGYYKTERISLGISVRNSSLREATGPLKISYWIFGKSSGDSKFICLFSRGSIECDLGTNATNREFKTSTTPYLNKFYDPSRVISSSDYFEYHGWAITVNDPSGRLVLVKANKPEWERQATKLESLDTSRVYNIRLDHIPGARPPYRL